jgi:hypothetical protein
MAAAAAAVAAGHRLRLVFLVFHPHLFLSALAGRALRQMLLTVQRVDKLGLINLQTLPQQCLLTVLLLKRVLLRAAAVAVEVVDQPLVQLVQQLSRGVLAEQALIPIGLALVVAGLLVVVWVLVGLAALLGPTVGRAAAAAAVLAVWVLPQLLQPQARGVTVG